MGVGEHTVAVNASDGFGAVVLKTFNVRIEASGRPRAVAAEYTTAEDTPLSIHLDASDPDGDPILYRVFDQELMRRGGSVQGDGGPDVVLVPPANYSGPLDFWFCATDGALDSFSASIHVDVQPVPDPPVIYDGPRADGEDEFLSTSLDLVVRASDADGDALSYEWTVLDAPEGEDVSFSPNDSGAAATTAATFSSVGT